MHLPFFCKSLSECEYTFGITITVLKISQNNDNRGRHLEFYSHTGIGKVVTRMDTPSVVKTVSGTGFGASQFGLNLSSGSGSGFGIPAFPYALPTPTPSNF